MAPEPCTRMRTKDILTAIGLVIGTLAIGGVAAQAEPPAISVFTSASHSVRTPVSITGTGFVDATAIEIGGTSAQGRGDRVRAGSPSSAGTDWPQFRNGVSHRGFNRFENVLSVSNVGHLTRVWRYTTGSQVNSSPTVVDGVLYVGSRDGNLYALDASTGALLWSYPAGGDSSPAVVDGLAYIAAGDVHALDVATGALLWTYEPADEYGVEEGSPAVRAGVLHVASGEGNVYAIDAQTGVLLWSRSIGGDILSSPAVGAGAVYIGSSGGKVYALDAATGIPRWTRRVAGEVLVSAAVAHGVVYISSNRLYALSAKTGGVLWSRRESVASIGGSVAVARGVVYFGTGTGDVHARDASTADLLWSTHIHGGDVISSAAVANGVVYIGGSNDKIQALDASTGDLLWSYRTGNGVRSSPTVVNGMVYVGSKDGKVYAFGLQ